jgi:glycosyltransferase involved in cell wall biosynthesis
VRILLVADVDPVAVVGGAERLLAGHAEGLAARGHDVIVCSGAPGPEGTHGGTRVVRIGRTPSTPRKAAAAVRELRPDAVLGYQPACALGALRAAARRSIPTFYVFSSSWPQEYATRRRSPRRALHALRWAVEHACLRASDRIVVLSEYSAAKVRKVHGSVRSPIAVVPGGVDTDQFSPNGGRHAARARLHLPAEGPLLVSVRNLVPRMGLDNLLSAMPKVLWTFPRARLVLAGAGPLRRALEAQAARLGVADRVTFAGFVPEELLPDYYRAADLAVLPTRALEGFGLATIEALACGTPVLGTPVGATPEILAPLEPGLLTEGVSPDELAAAIVRFLFAEPGDLSRRAREHVLSRYNWALASERLEAVIREAIS